MYLSQFIFYSLHLAITIEDGFCCQQTLCIHEFAWKNLLLDMHVPQFDYEPFNSHE